MLLRLLKFTAIFLVVCYAAQTIGLSDQYRADPLITESDFTAAELAQWQTGMGDALLVEQGNWYWSLFGIQARVTYENHLGDRETLYLDKAQIPWQGCRGAFSFQRDTATLESSHDPACIGKASFRHSVERLLAVVREQVIQAKEEDWFQRRIVERNLRSWSRQI